MLIHDRGLLYHNYLEIGIGFTIKSFTFEEAGYIENWELALAGSQLYKGDTKEDFLKTLNMLFPTVKKYSESKKDLVIIYTDNLDKIKGFFKSKITAIFGDIYIQLNDFFEFRSIKKWKDLSTAIEISEYAQYIIDNIFLPEKYFYITPNQRPRKKIAKACNEDIAKNIFPKSFYTYKLFRKALFGGICYVAYPTAIIEEDVICLDLKSAYIFDLIIEKHCIEPFLNVDKNDFEKYLNNENYNCIGQYHIKYKNRSSAIHCFKDKNGKKIEKDGEVDIILTNIDLKIFLSMSQVENIECIWLYAAKNGKLPKYFLDVVVENYYLKEILEGRDRDLQKGVLNGIYGDCIRIFETEDEFYSAAKNPSIAPQWGIFTTSYCRKNLLEMATQLDGWYYSDTDSIYCKDTLENREKINAFNENIQKRIKEFCDEYNYNYEFLKNIGTFQIEKEIKKFRAMTYKIYMYQTKNNDFKLTAAGLDQKTIEVSEKLFYNKKIDYGYKTFKFFTNKITECNINGKHYISNGSYYEKQVGGLHKILLQSILASKLKEQY